MRVALAAATGVLLVSGCGPDREAGRAAGRARLEVQREHLEASLDRLEARLLDGQARVAAWREARARHGRVTAIACRVNERHAEDMARVALEDRWRAAGLEVPRVLAGGVSLAGRGGGGSQAAP